MDLGRKELAAEIDGIEAEVWLDDDPQSLIGKIEQDVAIAGTDMGSDAHGRLLSIAVHKGPV